MKVLLIGIDGGDDVIFRNMPMPFYAELRQELRSIPLKEDLWSRGWANILTGKPGTEHGGFYEKPALDGCYRFTQSFNTKAIAANTAIQPLWQLDPQATFGIMNVPGTVPAVPVKGFMVSGAGGGLGKVEGVPAAACYPAELKAWLDAEGYILDIRYKSSAISDWKLLIDQLIGMQEKRTTCYIDLVRKYQVDMGFVAFMATSRVQNLAMYEITQYLNNAQYTSLALTEIKRLYTHLDSCLKRLYNELKAGAVILTSDHGAAAYRYTVNVEKVLQKQALAKTRSALSPVQLAKRLLPSLVKERLKSWLGGKTRQLEGGQAMSQTKAFGHRYVPGIYLNDDRFPTPSVREDEYEDLVQRICTLWNNTTEAKQHQLRAVPYRMNYPEARYQALLPDIWIEHPDTYFFDTSAEDTVVPNNRWGAVNDLAQVSSDIHTGIKGSGPLCLLSSCLLPYVEDVEARDLTFIHTLLSRYVHA